jgi:hypothetical protein
VDQIFYRRSEAFLGALAALSALGFSKKSTDGGGGILMLNPRHTLAVFVLLAGVFLWLAFFFSR